MAKSKTYSILTRKRFLPSSLKSTIMKKYLLVVCLTGFCSLFLQDAFGQNYKSAAGIRLGSPWSASYKTFISESNALEVYAGYRGWSAYHWFSVNGAYLIHKAIPSVENLQWYFGGGAGVYFWSYDSAFADANDATSFSIQGYLGLDYKFANTPVSITADWVPTVFLTGFGNGFGAGYGNLGVRYVLSQ